MCRASPRATIPPVRCLPTCRDGRDRTSPSSRISRPRCTCRVWLAIVTPLFLLQQVAALCGLPSSPMRFHSRHGFAEYRAAVKLLSNPVATWHIGEWRKGRTRTQLDTRLRASKADIDSSTPGGDRNVATVAESDKIQSLREELERNSTGGSADETHSLTFEEWKTAFGGVIDPSELKTLFRQLDADRNGKVTCMHVHVSYKRMDPCMGQWHPCADQGHLQAQVHIYTRCKRTNLRVRTQN